jgi:hypothetical protein
VAQLYDAGGDNTYFGSRPVSSLKGAGYLLQVSNFFQVSAFAESGGHDTANLYDALQNDVFETLGANAELFGKDYVLLAYGFGAATANDQVGSNDQLFVQPAPYAFQQTGNWTVPPPGTPPPAPPTNRAVIA